MPKLKGYLERKEGEILGIASTEAVDRDGEIIKQDGWDLENFKKNPVLLVSHNYQEFPVGKATEIQLEDNKLIFKAVFSEATAKAREAYQLVKEGILNAFSVGFIPREYDVKDQNIITKSELLEISIVPVPANPEAMVLAKSFKENNLAQHLAKHWLIDEEEKTDEEIKNDGGCPDCKCQKSEKGPDENATGVAESDESGEDSEEANEIDLKLIQRTTGMLQELCRELKQKGGVKK